MNIPRLPLYTQRHQIINAINRIIDRLNLLGKVHVDGKGCSGSIGPSGINIHIPSIGEIVDGYTIFFGKPTGAFSSGDTITLDPCDVNGTDNGKANVTAYVQASKASYSMTNSTTIPTSCICPFVFGADLKYYLLGNPVEIVTDVDVTSTAMTKKTRNAWSLTIGTESAAQTIDTFTTSCP